MTVKIFCGLDLGYNKVKGITRSRRFQFASVTGTPEQSSFSVGGDNGAIIMTHPRRVAVGEQAIMQSKSLAREIDRDWISSEKWLTLALASFSEMTTGSSASLSIVTGLPISFYGDKALVQERLVGQHSLQRLGRRRQTLTVEQVRVVPQAFGALLAETMNDNGKIVDLDLRNGRVGVVDVGGKTTNFLLVDGLRQIDKDSASGAFGGWSVVNRVKTWLESEHGYSVNEYQLVPHVVSKSIKVSGQTVDLTPVVDDAANDLAMDVVGQARRLWNGGKGVDTLLVCGGGAHIVGSHILRQYSQARIVSEPTFANAQGYFNFAQAVF